MAMGGRGSAGSTGASRRSEFAGQLEKSFDDKKAGKTYQSLPANFKKSIRDNLKMSENMRNAKLKDGKSNISDTWKTGIGNERISVTTSVENGKLIYTVKKRNKILMRTGKKEKVANTVSKFYSDILKRK